MAFPARRQPDTPGEPGSGRRATGGRSARVLKGLSVALLVIVALLGLAVLALNLAEGLIRDYAVRQLNDRVAGYTFAIGRLDLHPLRLSLDMRDVTVRQEAHPDPPVAVLPRWRASIQFWPLVRGQVVGAQHLEEPRLYVNLGQLTEGPKAEPAQAWQDAVLALMPVTLKEVTVEGGEVTYQETAASAPVALTDVNVRLGAVRNVASGPREYPSTLHVDGRMGEQGRLVVDGKVAPFAKPMPGVHADFRLEALELAPLRPILASYGLFVSAGRLSGAGHTEYSQSVQFVELDRLSLEGLRADYIHATPEAPTQKAAEAAKKASDEPSGLVLTIKDGAIRNGDFGFVDKTTTPEYRVFLSRTEAQLTNVSNHATAGTGFVTLRGQFMGSGDTTLTGSIRPETQGANFDLNLKVEDTALPSMNDLLRAYGKLDVTEGRFSVYSELTVRERRVEGYIKPLIRDMKVYDRRQERGKGVLQRVYEGVAGGISNLLENEVRDEMATKADVSGSLDDAQLNVWQAVVRLFRNAFLRAILPGFEDRDEGTGRQRG